jgi:hypothetical protein
MRKNEPVKGWRKKRKEKHKTRPHLPSLKAFLDEYPNNQR